jgi:5-bromo-4-chloroindolyl phosphate hydrolysis protein
VGRYDWQRMKRRAREWQRYDRDDDRDDDRDGRSRSRWHDRNDDPDSDAPRESGDSLMEHFKSRGMAGSLLFWLIIWAFTAFSSWLFPIFLGIALLQGWGWDKAEKVRGRRRDRGRDRKNRDRNYQDREPIGAAPPLDGSAPTAPPMPNTPAKDDTAHQKLIRETAEARAQLSAAASAADGQLGDNLRRMDRATRTVVERLDKDPSDLAHVQRMFTYYLPSAAQLLTARKSIIGTNNLAHQAEIDGMFGRLADAFEGFVARINGTDIRSLEIDLKLLEQSLDAEFDPLKRS